MSLPLKASCEEVHSLSSGLTIAYVIDGMTLFQCLKETQFTTFNELGSQVMQYITSLLKGDLGVVAVTIVFDWYDNYPSNTLKDKDVAVKQDIPMSSMEVAQCQTT